MDGPNPNIRYREKLANYTGKNIFDFQNTGYNISRQKVKLDTPPTHQSFREQIVE